MQGHRFVLFASEHCRCAPRLGDDRRPAVPDDGIPIGRISCGATAEGSTALGGRALDGGSARRRTRSRAYSRCPTPDVKPENVLLSDYGIPKLADFGLAQIEGATTTSSPGVTTTIAHAAPELLGGTAEATVASDMYSLGSTVFTLVVGTPPFWRDDDPTAFALIGRVLTGQVPDLRQSGVPDDMCSLLEQALASDPSVRFRSGKDFAAACQGVETSHGLERTEVVGLDDLDDVANGSNGGAEPPSWPCPRSGQGTTAAINPSGPSLELPLRSLRPNQRRPGIGDARAGDERSERTGAESSQPSTTEGTAATQPEGAPPTTDVAGGTPAQTARSPDELGAPS